MEVIRTHWYGGDQDDDVAVFTGSGVQQSDISAIRLSGSTGDTGTDYRWLTAVGSPQTLLDRDQ